jgi:creatinine amidohydrolase/Fe(II)-dependent formamide hydrolase-like protein
MKRYQRFSAAGILLAVVMFSTSQQVAAQVLRIAEMNTQQILALNLQKTVVLIPGGILEEHGPYLPSYTDGYADAYTRELAKAIVARPGWTVVLFPQIPLGNDPANITMARQIITRRSTKLRIISTMSMAGPWCICSG